MKKDNHAPEHLGWLVASRTTNQKTTLRLFNILEKHSINLKQNKALSPIIQAMVATCFSLWRAAFLADKTGERTAVLADAKAFLGKLLTDNAINYAQDRGAREWTFNYYMNSARDCLLQISKTWPEVNAALNEPRKVPKGSTTASRRWDRQHKAFETAIDCLETALRSMPQKALKPIPKSDRLPSSHK